MSKSFSQTNISVQFVSGINYHKELEINKSKNYIATWRIHPEDVAAEKAEVGAAIIFNPKDFSEQSEDGIKLLLISKPTKKMETWITSANGREAEINTLSKFIGYLNK